MILKNIEVENFRNIERAELTFASGVNVFYGDNAQGKTNLLEAVALCLGKSFRNIRRGEILPLNTTARKVKIRLCYESEKIVGKINMITYECDYDRVLVKINDIPLKKASDLYGEFKYVIFIPDNLNLIKGYPDNRRQYLDNIAIMQNKSHRKFLSEYNAALRHRCATHFNECSDRELIAVWDDILIKQGINLTYGRYKYLELIRQYACKIYNELSGGEILEATYNSNVFGEVVDFTETNILYDKYKQKLHSVNSEGQSSKTPGAHLDDVIFTIDGNSARKYASQGQLRSIAISLKLAEAQIIRDFNRENSVVLLDEVLGELDEKRRHYVIQHFVDSQVFITSCNCNDFGNMENIRLWSVENGVFTPRQ
ncbi:MAG: DNA replication and repair protein RecF [Oscillospiraceae bacterium]|nr:DNA replication and repair protein RecF [Oscillospiraceae bacterium]